MSCLIIVYSVLVKSADIVFNVEVLFACVSFKSDSTFIFCDSVK